MKRIALFSVVALMVAVVAAIDVRGEKDKEKPPPVPVLALEMKLLEGTWQLSGREVEGQKENLEGVTIRVVVKDGKYTVQMGENAVEQGAFRIDPTTKPKSIDAIPESGDNKGKTILAVYDVTADELRMCVAQEGGKRPTELATKQGSGLILNTYKRQAAPAPKQ